MYKPKNVMLRRKWEGSSGSLPHTRAVLECLVKHLTKIFCNELKCFYIWLRQQQTLSGFLGRERGKMSFGGLISVHTKLLGSLAGPGFTAVTSLNSHTPVFPLSPTSANLLALPVRPCSCQTD